MRADAVLRTALAVGCAFALLGCGHAPDIVACTAQALAGLVVRVTDATGQPVCDAAVTASEGQYSERLTALSCTFAGAFERPGNYVVTATRAGFASTQAGPVRVIMGGGECPHVEPVSVTLTLVPER